MEEKARAPFHRGAGSQRLDHEGAITELNWRVRKP
jgi:hypothetical protein